jgi:hypothetical protein
VFPFVFRTQDTHQWGLWTHWESYLYVGLAPLVLAIVALVCIRRRQVLGWGVLGLVGLMLALGQYSPLNLHYWVWLLPGMSGLRAPGRFTLIAVLAAAMLAAHGLTWLQRDRQRLPSDERATGAREAAEHGRASGASARRHARRHVLGASRPWTPRLRRLTQPVKKFRFPR